MRKYLTVLFVAICIFGCRQEMSPLVSGMVIDGGLFPKQSTVVEKDKTARPWALSNMQLDKLSSWLKSHQSDWQMVLTSPPLPSYSVLLVHSKGEHTQLDLFSINESWKHAIHIHSNDKEGKIIFGGTYSFSSEEIVSLKQLLAEGQ